MDEVIRSARFFKVVVFPRKKIYEHVGAIVMANAYSKTRPASLFANNFDFYHYNAPRKEITQILIYVIYTQIHANIYTYLRRKYTHIRSNSFTVFGP